ncbi:hypothetical protein NMG60_11028797 [Bertholletia excelsa]
MEKQSSFRGVNMEKQQSFKGVMEKQQSFKRATEKQKSFRGGMMEKQKSFRGFIEKQKSFRLAIERQFSFSGEKKRGKESPGKRGDFPIHAVVRAGNLSKIRDILQRFEADAAKEMLSKQNQEGETALYVAAEIGDAHVVGELLRYLDLEIASIPAKNTLDPLHIAAKQGHLEVLKNLLHSFPNLVMTTDSSNSTALHTAAAQGHIEVVNLLLETYPNLAKIARNNGKTVLHTAARKGHLEVVKSLLHKDPSIGFRTDKKGQTALHMAVKGQCVDIVLELIKPESAVLTLKDNRGNIALHMATIKGKTEIVRSLLSVDGIDVNAANKSGETPLDIAEKLETQELITILREAGATNSKDHGKPPNRAKQLKQTVSDIKHDVQSQLQQTRQTGVRVRKIAKKLKKLHINGLNNAINSATIVAVLIATVAFAAIFTVPGQFVEDNKEKGVSRGQAHIAKKAPFLIFFVSDSAALFISLAVVVVQTSVVVIEQRAKKQLVFVINKLMWLACLFISIAFISLGYVVVGTKERWLAVSTTLIGGLIMLSTIGMMCICIIQHRMEASKLISLRRNETLSRSYSMSMASDGEIFNEKYQRVYAV